MDSSGSLCPEGWPTKAVSLHPSGSVIILLGNHGKHIVVNTVEPEEVKLHVTAVVLAGGRALRMGGQDKGLLPLAGAKLIDYVLRAIKPQVDDIIINANRNLEAYSAYGYRVVPDLMEGFHGPLAGMASAMQGAHTPYIMSAPCDSPFVPTDLARRLYQALRTGKAEISMAHNGERAQPVFALIPRCLLPSLLSYLNAGERKIDRWFYQHTWATADFSDVPEAFLNINTPEDMRAIEARLSTSSLNPEDSSI